MDSVGLTAGVCIPKLGFGTYQIKDPVQCEQAVLNALEAGYRAIDTAASYGNEDAVGAALKHCGIPREEIFLSTKLWVEDASEDGAKRAVERSLELLKTDHIDLFYIHQPVGDVFGAWRTLESLHEEGVLRAIGISNFYPDRLLDFTLCQRIKPQALQLELNPFCQQRKSLELCRELGIVPVAWAPLAEGRNGLFDHAVLRGIADKHHKSVAQITLRWVLQQGACVVCKSVHPERMVEDLQVNDFTLDDEDLKAISALDQRKSQFFSHQDPEIIRWFHSRHIKH